MPLIAIMTVSGIGLAPITADDVFDAANRIEFEGGVVIDVTDDAVIVADDV